MAFVKSVILKENFFEQTEFSPKDLNFYCGDFQNPEKFQVNFINFSNQQNGENLAFLRTFQILSNFRLL